MKRLFTASLALLLLLVSCGNGDGGSQTQTTQTGEIDTTPQQEEIVIDKSNVLSLFERQDYDGKAFRVIASDTFNASIVVPQAPLEYENGDRVNDALYQRDAMIKDYFNIDIEYTIPENDTVTGEYVRRTVSTQEDVYDMGLASMTYVTWPLAQEGMIRDINEIDEIDLTADWWNKSLHQRQSLHGYRRYHKSIGHRNFRLCFQQRASFRPKYRRTLPICL